LAYLGVGKFVLIDHEQLDITNKNRYVTAYADDPVPGSKKVDLARRHIYLINPQAEVLVIPRPLRSRQAFEEIALVDYVFGCLDNDASRLVLNELCSAYRRPYFDLATEIIAGPRLVYGGRVFVAWGNTGCLVCRGLLDLTEARIDLDSAPARQDHANLYGLPTGLLAGAGPSVVSLNGVVASLAVTEFGVAVSSIRAPHALLTYRADLGRVTLSADKPATDCYYCKEVYGVGKEANIERYVSDTSVPGQ
jgi:hypothetical protein